MSSEWIKCETKLPPEDVVVDTKIDEGGDCLAERTLKRYGTLWWVTDGSTYAYCRPTHWKPRDEPERKEPDA